jgi:hypothetical protein
MDLKDFVSVTLRDISDGVTDAIKNHQGMGGFSVAFKDEKGEVDWTKNITNIEFDIAVTTTDKTGASGKAGIKILSIAEAGGGFEKGSERVAANRIKFSVPIILPSQVFETGQSNAASGVIK